MGVLYARVGGAWVEVGGQAAGVTDHGNLTGLGDDDHPQYLKPAEVTAGTNVLVNYNPDGSIIVGSPTHKMKHRVTLAVLGSTPVTSWTQMNFGGAYNVEDTSGTLVVQANPGGVFITEAGWYHATWTVMTDRVLNGVYLSIKYGAKHVAFANIIGSTPNWRFSVSGAWYVGPSETSQWVTINAQTPTPCWLGGQNPSDDRFSLTSLF